MPGIKVEIEITPFEVKKKKKLNKEFSESRWHNRKIHTLTLYWKYQLKRNLYMDIALWEL